MKSQITFEVRKCVTIIRSESEAMLRDLKREDIPKRIRAGRDLLEDVHKDIINDGYFRLLQNIAYYPGDQRSGYGS